VALLPVRKRPLQPGCPGQDCRDPDKPPVSSHAWQETGRREFRAIATVIDVGGRFPLKFRSASSGLTSGAPFRIKRRAPVFLKFRS